MAKKSKKKTFSLPFKFRLPSRRGRSVRFSVIWLIAYFILVSVFFNSVLENFNYIEIFPGELNFPLLMHAVTALIIALVIYFIPFVKTFPSKLLSALFLALFVVKYNVSLVNLVPVIKAVVPGVSDKDSWAILSIFYFVFIVSVSCLLGFWLDKLAEKVKRVNSKDVALGAFVLAAYLFVIPSLSVASKLPTMIKESRVKAAEISAPANSSSNNSVSNEKPDIYYIVLDRYTNNEVLKNQFNFDNSDFSNFLKDKNFKVNDNANSNYPYTAMSIASTLNADYINKFVEPYKNNPVQSRTLFHNAIWNSSVVKALKKSGYKYVNIGSWYGTDYKSPLADQDLITQQKLTLFGHSRKLRGVERIEFEKSFYFQFTQLEKIKWWPFKYVSYNDGVKQVSDQLNALDDVVSQPNGGRFIFAHILVPHDPFVFNADGSINEYQLTDSAGLAIKKKYTNQVEFINSQMKELVDKIQKQSGGKSVIIFNPDEGAWPQYMNHTVKDPQLISDSHTDQIFKQEDMTKWSQDWLKMKFGIMQAVYIPSATEEDLAHLSSVNLFRIILNRYAGYNLDYLPECHFGLTDGSLDEYLHADVGKQLTGQSDPACQNYQSTK